MKFWFAVFISFFFSFVAFGQPTNIVPNVTNVINFPKHDSFGGYTIQLTNINNQPYGVLINQSLGCVIKNGFNVKGPTNIILGASYLIPALTLTQSIQGYEGVYPVGHVYAFVLSDNFYQTNLPMSMTPTNTSKIFIGVKLNYGTNLNSITSENHLLLAITNPPSGQFYGSQLIQTNNPIGGLYPKDGNYYVYIDAQIQSGTSLNNLLTQTFQYRVFTNPPAFQFYSQNLIITNNPF